MQESTNVYFILGTPKSGRREILCDLIEGSSYSEETKNFILIASDESKSPRNERLQALSNTTILDWSFSDKSLIIPDLQASSNDRVFVILSSRNDLIDQIEKIKYWLDTNPQFAIARILSVIDCQIPYKKEYLLAWFEAAIYFSDYVFLTHRENIPEKWISDFLKSFEKKSYPCLFEKVKNNKVANPDQVLEPEARRISHIFDNLDAVDTLDLDEENLPEEPFEIIKKLDPYLERDSDGNRMIIVPPISD